ncbi:ABC transporter ATP-binding protein [Thermodesulfobacteriota bacterium]
MFEAKNSMTTDQNTCQPVLELVNLGKKIRKKQIVKNINLSLNPSEVYGFLGPNGAGKTTTIRMIVGLIKPSEGFVNICGHNIARDFIGAMSNVGCIIESPDLYKFMTGIENLLQFAAMDKRITGVRIHEVIELVGLRHRIVDKVGTYSLGMRQRLGIAQAILCRPKLLILDEPTSGLDPAGITDFRKLIKKLAYEDGMSVFISSHLLSEAQQMCDKVAIIKQGQVIKVADVTDIISGEIIEWELSNPAKAILMMKDRWKIDAVQHKKNMIRASIGENSLENINKGFIKSGIDIKFCRPKAHTLEDLFLELTEGDEIV